MEPTRDSGLVWNAPKGAVLSQHPQGYAAASKQFWTSFEPSPRYDLIAEAAGGAFAASVREPNDLKMLLEDGLCATREGRCAVVNVILK